MKSLCDLCIEKLSRNLDLYDCLENLPLWISERILLRFAAFFKQRLGKLNDDSVVGYFLLQASLSTQPLTCLNLPYCNRLTDEGLVQIATKVQATTLTTINLAHCTSVSDRGVAALVKACPHLVRLDLTFTKVGDVGIQALVQSNCQTLEHLTLEQCSCITDQGIQTLARGLKRGRLTHLNIGGCSQVSNVGIQILASHLKGLRVLSLSGCDCLIDFDIEDITKDLVLLEELSLRCCWRLTDTAIRHVARMARKQSGGSSGSGGSSRNESVAAAKAEQATQERRKRVIEGGSASSARSGFGLCLKRLDIGGCKRITSRGVVCVAKSAVHLEKLDLRGMGENVNDDTLGAIRGILKELQCINVQGCACTVDGIALMQERGVDVVGCTAVATRVAGEEKVSAGVSGRNGHNQSGRAVGKK